MEKKPINILQLANHSNHRLWLLLLLISISATFLLLLRLRDGTCTLLAGSVRVQPEPESEPCHGRYIYIQNPPSRFNRDLLRRCDTTFTTWTDRNMCPHLHNQGLGSRLQLQLQLQNDDDDVLLLGQVNGTWYLTNLYSLSVIFHSRMLNYQCLTNDSSLASAVYVPYYAGLDASRHLWSGNFSLRDESAAEFDRWVGETAEWKRMWGRDHFMVSGRTAWDFRREWDEGEAAWGTRLRLLPHSHNMSMLSVESSLWSNDYAIPYPTCFHPSLDSHLSHWQRRMQARTRRYLFSFAGAPRDNDPNTLRARVIDECRASGSLCRLLGCGFGPGGAMDCDDPARVMSLLQDSVFCLQPRGDSFTRRSFFDSIVAGCIPVMFHPGSAYVQYRWYLPEDHTRYSVYIPVESEGGWRPGIVTETLLGIPQDRVGAMRDEVIGLIPKVVYAHPSSGLESYEDAFDVAVNGILERIARVRRRIEEGEDPSVGFADRNNSKFDPSMYHHHIHNPGT